MKGARFQRWITLLLPLWLAGCAKTGDPQPPVVLVPKPAANLAAIEYGDRVLLTVAAPAQNTNGSPVTTLREIEVLRRPESGPVRSAPLAEREFMEGAAVILRIPAERVADYLNDKTLMVHDDLQLPDRAGIYRTGFRYAVRFVNRKGQSAGLSNQVFISLVPIPPPPSGLRAEINQEFIRIRWEPPLKNLDGSAPARVIGYNVYRTEDPAKFPPGPLNSAPVQSAEFEDRAFQFDKTYHYAVSVVASLDNPYAESRASGALEVNPRDTFPPGAPGNLNAVVTDGVGLLLWAAPPDRDVAGYRIYRGEEGASPVQVSQKELVQALSFRDERVTGGKKYLYRVAAVDTHGNEGAAAEVVLEVR